MRSHTGTALTVALSLCGIAQGYVLKVRSHDGSVEQFNVRSGNITAEEFLSSRQAVPFHQEVHEREAGCVANPRSEYYYTIIGNGNPHQNYKIAQIENTLISCPGSVATGEEHTFGWSIGGGFNPGVDKYDFASLDFSVEESDTKTVQEQFNCATGGDMSEICAMHYTAVTAVTVDFRVKRWNCNLSSDSSLGQGVVYLPNANGVGSVVSRGTNFGDRNIIQCRGQAAREIDFFCGPPGGPEWFDTHELGPWSDAYQAQKEPQDCAVPIEAFKFRDS